ncbi:MAG: helix-turn-helix transcriptional regulator [Hyphomicrobiaceae bacterium]
MGTRNTPAPDTSSARLEFAQRLRELRIPRGFRTARSLARALEIDENRYTRYERAEVEPDLAMIRRICETLSVTPSELLGVSVARPPSVRPSDGSHPGPGIGEPEAGASDQRPDLLSTAAWALAESAVELMRKRQSAVRPSGVSHPRLAVVAETGRLYRALMRQPYESITELLADANISEAGDADTEPLRQTIDQFLAVIKARP